MRPRKLASSVSLLQLLVSIAMIDICQGIPTVLIESGKARCVSIDRPLDTIIHVSYEAPDVILDQKDPKYGPAYVTVNVRPRNRVFETDLHNAPVRDHLKPTSHLIEAQQGSVTHEMEMDGTATICLRASTASAKNTMAFGLQVSTSEEIPSMRLLHEKAKRDAVTTDVDQHLTHMENELQRITTAMDVVLKEADLNQNQDAIFHQQTIAMHSATTFWPIVQVCVLLMTGFTQASHIVRFFKSRRII